MGISDIRSDVIVLGLFLIIYSVVHCMRNFDRHVE